MPTLEEARRLAEQYEGSYPDSLPDRLTWWADVLRISRARLLRLMGLSLIEVVQAKGKPWPAVVQRHAARAWRLEDMLCQLLARYSYDWKGLAEDLNRRRKSRRSNGRAPAGSSLGSISQQTVDAATRKKGEPGVRLAGLIREQKLIRAMNRGGPNSLELLHDLLASW